MLIIAALLLLLLAATVGGVNLARIRERNRSYRSLLEQLPETIISVFDRDLRYQQILGATPGTTDAALRRATCWARPSRRSFPARG